MNTEQRLLRVDEAARLLGMKESGVRRWISLRRLPVVKLNRMVRIPLSALEDLITLSTVPARPGESLGGNRSLVG